MDGAVLEKIIIGVIVCGAAIFFVRKMILSVKTGTCPGCGKCDGKKPSHGAIGSKVPDCCKGKEQP